MKLELVHTIEVDGEWIVVKQDGKRVQNYTIQRGQTLEEATQKGMDAIDRIKRAKYNPEEILFSEEI